MALNKKKYVVLRDDHRVSETEYDTPEQASDEYGFWKRTIINGKDYSSRLEIAEITGR
jgi:hypothetical protein